MHIPSGQTAGYAAIDPALQTAMSTSNFATLVGDTAVVTGKWMYEVTLLTAGVQQVWGLALALML